MAINIAIETQKKYTWSNCGLSFDQLPKTWREAEQAKITAEITEDVNFKEVLSKKPILSFQERTIFFADGISKHAKPTLIERLAFEDSFVKQVRIVRVFNEHIGFEELLRKTRVCTFAEKFGFRDDIIRASDSVLSDILIKNKEMTFDDFVDATNTPVLHNKFIDFKVGEYEHEKAMIKLQLATVAKESYPSIVGCTMHVDIPDTIDKGSVVIDTPAPKKVFFNRHYYNPPEVVATIKGGNTANGYIVPNIISTDGKDSEGRYFEVELLDFNGNRVTGSISWSSTGY